MSITPAILRMMKEYWTLKCSQDDSSYVFLRVFRASEVCVWTLNLFDASKHLSLGDVTIDNPTALESSSKTDQLGKGADIFIVPSNGSDVLHGHEGCSDGPFFKFQPLTKPYFTQHICENLKTIGSLESNFTGHSFRIRTATAAANTGIKDSTIHALGQ